MLSLNEIKAYYPASLQVYERFILREYLQYKILEIIFDSPFGSKLSFLGGTCLRLIYGNHRFSEDLDFDNFNLSPEEFDLVSDWIKKQLALTGYETEVKNVYRGAYHCYIRFPELLFNEGLSNFREEKILIQIDTESQGFQYQPDQPLLNKFDVFTQINTTPKSTLLAQKFFTVMNRKRNKGRDFYDIIFLLGMDVLPDYSFLDQKMNVHSPEALRDTIFKKCLSLDMNEMAQDVKPFLFHPGDIKKVALFPQYILQAKL